MQFETIDVKVDARGVARVFLNRPDKHNALSARMIAEMTGVADKLAGDGAVRVVILGAHGESFCAGGDLAWMAEQMRASRAERIAGATKLADMLYRWNVLPKPVIARIHGNAFGGGVGLISVCDLAICSKKPVFGLTETKLGLIPATISPYVFARIGENKAREYALSARIFDAPAAESIGLVSRVVDDSDAEIEAEVARFMQVAPKAVAATKALVRSLGVTIDAEVIAGTVARLADTWEQEEAREGIEAFFARRTPDWVRK